MIRIEIKVVDAMMGRGKTTAAINYMTKCGEEKRFLYITPFLSEVDRICEQCDFDQPESDHETKLSELKRMLRHGKNIASTHSLFYLLDDEAMKLIQGKTYSIIIDESINTVQHVPVTKRDREIILSYLADLEEDGRVVWREEDYVGKYTGYKELADSKSLYALDTTFISVLNPDVLRVFDEVIMMTYMFGGQYQKAYLDFFGFDYKICGVSDDGRSFTDQPDRPPNIDYKSMIHIVTDRKMNEIGDGTFALSKAWYERRGRNNEEMRTLRNNMNTFFRRRTESSSHRCLWTCFKSDAPKLYGDKNRFASSFLQTFARASNAYRDRDIVAYMVNRFVDPNIAKFFASHDIQVDADEFALGEMLQWIWRSAIRDGKPIDLYIPSRRMRELLIGWIESLNNGGDASE